MLILIIFEEMLWKLVGIDVDFKIPTWTWILKQPTSQTHTPQVLIRRSYRAFGVSKDSVIRIERKEAAFLLGGLWM